VTPATAGDVWVTDGLARYAEGMYVENAAGHEALDRALEDYAVGALMFEQAAPIAQAGQLVPYSPEYRSVVQNKGAMVFHMLRSQMGDAAFQATLRDFYSKFAGHAARIEDFEKVAEAQAAQRSNSRNGPPLNLTAFFVQWLNSTGVPEFKLDYVVVRTRKGFLLRGDVKQDLETFRMPVEVRVATEGNPETRIIQVEGTKSDFTIETFGRPRPMGVVIDPNNNLLKSSSKLRVRALIGRGEDMAQHGDFYEAILEYQRALDVQKNSSLAHFRMAEASFYQKNYQAAAGAFREALAGDLEPKWVEVWCHIYIGKIFDLSGSRERAVNEYTKARDARDDTGGAQAEVAKYLAQPYKPEGEASRPTP
jgi:tetratricopeptide (TPR) repeat protein